MEEVRQDPRDRSTNPWPAYFRYKYLDAPLLVEDSRLSTEFDNYVSTTVTIERVVKVHPATAA